MTYRPDTDRQPALVVDMRTATVTIPHWGITLRTLYGAILEQWVQANPGERRKFTVIYKGAPIAVLNVQQHDPL